ncbi:Tim22-complex subunit TIM54 [Aspergillus clavatus NRRL 1]|uniref:Mitochondrial import inner membrane translocase subunit TIM54 n=1 Tax=Aspergillus clavatus (strain ATCC 1007 / CBS 513.65 / DSM 816 / NCTC 3887 / NRRL 1 / QM 1276 / 107) TaxID=344612 RepID=A1CIB7_ASPCL|nr:TIM complex component Tim54 [Aspergillus clavatus NRRL 1]EAW10622.1 TIM complex componenet Tim54 [Aspergillus clavatus NRRL 1]
MAEPSAATEKAPNASTKPTPKPVNPAFRMLGMPNLRFKLPSRNWMIFFTITGSLSAAIIYDRREKRRVQQKWSDLVAHISKEILPIDETRRKLTVYLAAPPGDGLRVARDHFKEYVKPILVAAALDYVVIEGRREGDVRAMLAERIRKHRRKAGEPSSVVEEIGNEDIIADARQRIGVTEEPGPKGDLVIGRHTWREYIRGLHEGWLGPLDPPLPPVTPTEEPSPSAEVPAASEPADGAPVAEFVEETTEKKEEPENKDEKPAKPTGPTPAYIFPAEYSSHSLPATLPQSFESSVPIQFPHLLGFLNTPIRLYRYLNRRHLADDIGREVAGIVLASSSRPYQDNSFSSDSELSGASVEAGASPVSTSDDLTASSSYEQQTVLEHEESEWHKSVHKKDETNPDKEREWLNEIVLDPRIASRMQRSLLSPEDEARSQRLAESTEYILGEERPIPVPFWKRMWVKYGYGEDEEALKMKPIIGNLDGEDGL